jgi:hypothetical protein
MHAQLWENDIALVFLEKPIGNWTDFIQPVQLPNVTQVDPSPGTVAIYKVIYRIDPHVL